MFNWVFKALDQADMEIDKFIRDLRLIVNPL